MSVIGFISGPQVCWCLPENATVCPMKKDRNCKKVILNVNVERVSNEEIDLLESLDSFQLEITKIKKSVDTKLSVLEQLNNK